APVEAFTAEVRMRRADSAVLILTVAFLLPSASLAQQKKYGFDDSKEGGGVGAPLTAADQAKINATLDKMESIGEFNAKDSPSTTGAKIAADLRKMMADG